MQHYPSKEQLQPHPDFDYFVEIIKILRSPDGCPWDLAQSHTSIRKNMIEEAYECAHAIDRGDKDELCDELGDLLEQVVLHAQIAADEGSFDINDVCRAAASKMLRRHPHVFYESKEALDRFCQEHPEVFQQALKGAEGAEGAKDAGETEGDEGAKPVKPQEVLNLWDQVKLMEAYQKEQKLKAEAALNKSNSNSELEQNESKLQKVQSSLMDGIPNELPAIHKAQKISRKAVSIGFEWDSVEAVVQSMLEEVEEFKQAQGSNKMLELGDILFCLVNVARKAGIDPEDALEASNKKFMKRFRHMEDQAQQADKRLSQLSLQELDELWAQAKLHEKSGEETN